ncbi:MAG: hypothetical protein KAH32_03130 [Chlamydiia bacterium]|nr:hypothetical protein [Chlamydiia bacterium]
MAKRRRRINPIKGPLKQSHEINLTVRKILQGRVLNVEYKDGFNCGDVNSLNNNSAVYSDVLFKLFELMALDVIAGDVVKFEEKSSAMLFIDTETAKSEIISGKGLHEDMKFPLIDFKKTQYMVPFMAIDSGHKDSTLAKFVLPKYLYGMLITEFNNGKRYIKSSKEFAFNEYRFKHGGR